MGSSPSIAMRSTLLAPATKRAGLNPRQSATGVLTSCPKDVKAPVTCVPHGERSGLAGRNRDRDDQILSERRNRWGITRDRDASSATP
jgi:hypothetical protein